MPFLKYHIDRQIHLHNLPAFKEARLSACRDLPMDKKVHMERPDFPPGYGIHSPPGEFLREWKEYLKQDDDEVTNAINLNGSLDLAVLEFEWAGSNIFDMSYLVDAFRNTSVDDIRVSDIKLPYEKFYLHFGQEAQIASPYEGMYVDGVYVYETVDELTETDKGDVVINDKPNIALHFVLGGPFYENLAGQNPLEIQKVHSRGMFLELKTLKLRLGFVRDGEATIKHTMDAILDDEYRDEYWYEDELVWPNHVEELIRIAVNALCYLCYEKREVVERYPDEAPQRLVRMAANGTPREKKRAESKLGSLGYSKVKFCGAKNEFRDSASNGQGGHTRTHWRRGHWRRQPFGPKLEKTKVLWIKPTLVNAEAKTDVQGKIYDCVE